MNLYLISQTTNEAYNTYDSAVVVAESMEIAKTIHPSGEGWDDAWNKEGHTWIPFGDYSQVAVRFVGIARPGVKEGTVILASFNAG